MVTNLLVNFDRLKESDFLTKMNVIVKAIYGNPAFAEPYPAQVPTLAAIQAKLTAYDEAFHAALTRDTRRINERNRLRGELTDQLKGLARYLEVVAQGDVDLLRSTGFDLRRERDPARAAAALPEPSNFRIVPTLENGTLNLQVGRMSGALAFEVQTSQADPSLENAWEHALISAPVQNIRVEGVKPGRTWARLRGISRNGNGPWSGPLSVMVG